MAATEYLLEIAKRARAEFEARQVSPELLAWLYLGYNSHVEIGSFLREAEQLFPRGNSGLASVYLLHETGLGRVAAGWYAGEPHTFLLIAGRTVVDITSDQYGGPPVYVGPLVAPWSVPAAQPRHDRIRESR